MNRRIALNRILPLSFMSVVLAIPALGSGPPQEDTAPEVTSSAEWILHDPANSDAGDSVSSASQAVVEVRDLVPQNVTNPGPPMSHIQGDILQYQFGQNGEVTSQVDQDSDISPAASAPDLFPDATNAVGDVLSNFNGQDWTGWIPPDTIMAVGSTRIMEATNSHFSVFQKDGTVVTNALAYSTFFSPVLPVGWQGFMFDPRVVYHGSTNQFVTLILGRDDTNSTSFFFVGVSQSSDPSGSWWVWRLTANDTGSGGADADSWADYAGLGVDNWGIYITTNLFRWTGGFKHAALHSFNPAMLSGGASNSWRFWNLQWPDTSAAFSLQPAHPHSIAGGQETFFVNTYSGSGGAINLWKMTGDRTSSPTLVNSSIGVSTYNFIGENIDQPGSTTDLDGGDARVMNAIYANRRVWTTLTTDVLNDGTHSGIFATRLNVDTAAVVNQRIYHSGAGVYYFYPAIVTGGDSADANIAIFLNWTRTSPAQYASAAVLVLMPDLTENVFPGLKSGEGWYVQLDSNNKNRWGDYSGASWDWSNGTAWGALEWAKSNNQWHTRIVEVDLLGGGAAEPDLVVVNPGVNDSTLTPGQAFTISATVRNDGTAASAATTLRYYRSTNSTITTADTQLGSDAIPGLAPTATSAQSLATTAPAAGTYWVGGCVDAVAGETVTNNQCSSGVQITVSGATNPDLIVIDPGVSASSLAPSQAFTIDATVRNQGAASSAATTLRYYLSTDSSITTGDSQQGTDAIPGLSPGSNSVQSLAATAPGIGTWWVGACVDSVSGETPTDNQCSSAVQINVSAGGGTLFADSFEGGAPLVDSDGDRLADAVETNTGVFIGPGNTGTDPNNPDSDGDHIEDGDEVLGTLAGLDLPAMGANPLKRNLLLEYDWFDDNLDPGTCVSHSHRPTAAALAAATAAFAAAPTANPDGSTGVTFIHDYGQGGAYSGGNLIADPDGVIAGGVNDAEFLSHKAANFAANRNGYFHYVLLPHRYATSSDSSGHAELPGDDLIVSLNCFGSDGNVSHTIIHELGHNLNLRHGGNTDCNYKPNYNSVMNYRYQFPGIDNNCTPPGDGVLNYSIGDRIVLNENSLNENAGTCGAPAWDWNGNGPIENPVVFNINSDDDFEVANCGGTLTTLRDYNDWANIDFSGLLDADRALQIPKEFIVEQPVPMEFR